MKIRKIKKSWKLSHNYNSFENEFEAELDENDDLDLCMQELKTLCRKHCNEDIKDLEKQKEKTQLKFD